MNALMSADTVEALMGGVTHNPYNIFMLGIGPMINAGISMSVMANFAEKGAWGPRLQNQVLSWKSTGTEVDCLAARTSAHHS